MSALICHVSGDLNAADIKQLCQLVLLANYTRLFEEPTQHDDEMRRLTDMVHETMARRLPELLMALKGNTAPLTAAVELILEETPSALRWEMVRIEGKDTGCFEAISGDHLYSVNIQTGVVLLDGLPPSRLPATILDD